jgi:hypothetical protein
MLKSKRLLPARSLSGHFSTVSHFAFALPISRRGLARNLFVMVAFNAKSQKKS